MDDFLTMVEEDAREMEKPPPPSDGLESLAEYGHELELLKEELDELAARTKAVKSRYDHLRQTVIPEEMQRLGMVDPSGRGSYTLSTGARITLVNDIIVGVKKADIDRFVNWVEDQGYPEQDVMKYEPSGAALKSVVKELMEQSKTIPPFISVFPKRTATLYKAR